MEDKIKSDLTEEVCVRLLRQALGNTEALSALLNGIVRELGFKEDMVEVLENMLERKNDPHVKIVTGTDPVAYAADVAKYMKMGYRVSSTNCVVLDEQHCCADYYQVIMIKEKE